MIRLCESISALIKDCPGLLDVWTINAPLDSCKSAAFATNSDDEESVLKRVDVKIVAAAKVPAVNF